MGIEKDRKFDITITENNIKIVRKIKKRKYNIQKIDGLPKKKVTPPEEFYTRIKKENKLIADAREIESDLQSVKAMNNGIVTLAEKDLFYTGATLIFDHGHGISTLYMHMDKIFVNKGDHVKKGDIVGTVGSSGRSTGPHLDIRLNWFGTRLDPATILNIK